MSDKKTDIIEMILFIQQRVGDLSLTEKKDIYQIINNSNVEDSKIQEKGGGIQIKFKNIPSPTIVEIYNFIKKSIERKLECLNDFTEENVDLDD
jgi:hypothetical protein